MQVRTFVIKPDAALAPAQSLAALPAAALRKYREQLNPAQLEAVTTTEGPLLVVAGAGTGKTKTLTYRAAYLVEIGVPASQILLLTFTRHAAQEMLRRAAAVANETASQIAGGTFHAYAHGVLRQYASVLGLSNDFTVLDQTDAEDTIDYCRTALGLHEKQSRFPRKHVLNEIISASANKQLSIEDIVNAVHPHFAHCIEEIATLAATYHSYKRRHNLLDYDDLLGELKRLLTEHEAIHRAVSGGWRYVMVDEYQDTNLVQAELVRLLSSVHGNVMVVGDDAQSIYSFRGANYRNILDFPQQYANSKVVKLEENYRSTGRILSVTNAIINQAHEKFTKHLYTQRQPEGEYPALVTAPDEHMESCFVAQRVLELREEGVPLHQIAVLMRNGHNSYDLEIELQRRKIPFVKHGGQKLVETAHIRDFLAYIKILHNPKDLVSWNRALLLLDGIGPRTARGFTEWIRDSDQPYALEKAEAPRKSTNAVRPLCELLVHLQSQNPGGEQSLASVTAAVHAYYAPILRNRYFDDYPRREADLENFLAVIGGFKTVRDLLSELALDPVEHAAIHNRLENEEKPLVLSTIHSAKGLEWHTVFVIHALDGIIPSSYALGDSAELDEELRLLYVALTRAKDLLYVCYPSLSRRRGFDYYLTNPSRFLSALPDDIYERLLLVQEQPPEQGPPALEAASEVSV